MNIFSCSLLYTWMTIIESLYYAFYNLSLDVSLEFIAQLIVARL